jgi:hypothetical protein
MRAGHANIRNAVISLRQQAVTGHLPDLFEINRGRGETLGELVVAGELIAVDVSVDESFGLAEACGPPHVELQMSFRLKYNNCFLKCDTE